MRVVADLSSFDILQVEKSPPLGQGRPFNGRFAVPVPPGASIQVDANSVVGGGGVNDVWRKSMEALLEQYPMYEFILYNPLLTDGDLLDLDPSTTWPAPLGGSPRLQTGRVGGVLNGMVPNSTAILPHNTRTGGADRPGLLVTDTIDIGPLTAAVGADEFLVWWHVYGFITQEDEMSDYGANAGANFPSLRNIQEADPEPGNFDVYISNDDGVTWVQTSFLDPTDLTVFDTSVRIAFRSVRNDRVYLAGFAILF
jgi:hypothetical protein